MLDPVQRAAGVRAALERQEVASASQLLLQWLRDWATSLPERPGRALLRQPELWACMADVVVLSGDHGPIERLWCLLDRLPPPPPSEGFSSLPLLGVPILNRPDLLERLLESLDHPVATLAIVDNSAAAAGPSAVSAQLEAIRERGHPLVDRIHIARPFSNLGVAASWNLILSSFPEASTLLLANNDMQFAPGVLQTALNRIDPGRAQFLPLLPPPHGFSAFLLTAFCWDRLGLFDANFHPAYCEDLDYRDRLQASAGAEELDGSFAHPAMTALNQTHSATIASDPQLRHYNGISYELNRLWYLSERRLRRDPRGSWRRLWLAQWSDDLPPQPPDHAPLVRAGSPQARPAQS